MKKTMKARMLTAVVAGGMLLSTVAAPVLTAYAEEPLDTCVPIVAGVRIANPDAQQAAETLKLQKAKTDDFMGKYSAPPVRLPKTIVRFQAAWYDKDAMKQKEVVSDDKTQRSEAPCKASGLRRLHGVKIVA